MARCVGGIALRAATWEVMTPQNLDDHLTALAMVPFRLAH